MLKYTANYAYTNSNFVIQNLDITESSIDDMYPIICVLKNILQRGIPTRMSKFLQEKIGEIHKREDYKNIFTFININYQNWDDIIKGDTVNNYFPAREFYENIPQIFEEYGFVQSLILPEVNINDIEDSEREKFINQQVDFFIPQANLVIEIDGQQHKSVKNQLISDKDRDAFLSKNKIEVVRITTDEWRKKTVSFYNKIESIKSRLKEYDKIIDLYKTSYNKILQNEISEEEIQFKLIPTAVIRFQILVLELLNNGYLKLDRDWRFNIFNDENLGNFAHWAVEDTLIWLKHLYLLKNKRELNTPNFDINICSEKSEFRYLENTINIDFSLFKRYTCENETKPNIIYVRTDYFEKNKKNYFRVSSAKPINYNITDKDKSCVEFFLQNIFDKPNFRDGQFPIVANALNLRDTIGLLPTGGGKSLCYQLPSLLQPSINFVVCPIKSLMYDQDENLSKIGVTNTAFITSDLNREEKVVRESNFEKGKYLLTWISPEKFQIVDFRNKIRSIVSRYSIAYAVIDEVHCLSEWGHSFRLSYLNLAKTIDKLSPKDEKGEGEIKFLGLTATASVNVLKDIKIEFSRQKSSLDEDNIKSLLDYSRKELQFEVINDNGNKKKEIYTLLEELRKKEGFLENNEKAGIIFTPNVNGEVGCYNVSNYINNIYKGKTGWYSGSIPHQYVWNDKQEKKKVPVMSEKEFDRFKKRVQKKFKNNEYPLLVATKSFGMGIDKDNIYYTIHYGLPSSVESLYQEAGRAGRWAKNRENADKIGRCYVLYSRENPQYNVERIFQQDTTWEEINDIRYEIEENKEGKDIIKQIFLFAKGQKDVKTDLELILKFIETFFQEGKTKPIHFKDLYPFGGREYAEKIIYRLTLLGIIKDYTTDFYTEFEVEFGSLDEQNILYNIENYIGKYEPNRNIIEEIKKINQPTFLEQSIVFLLEWIFNHIIYNRKQSLKTLSDWCSEFVDSDSFKKRIDSYFIFTETTFVFQAIGENPNNYENWFKVFYYEEETAELLENGRYRVIQYFIPKIKNKKLKRNKYVNLKDTLSRFLESYQNNVGINFVSGLIRLALNEFEDTDGRQRFENALEVINTQFPDYHKNEIFSKLKYIINFFDDYQKETLVLLVKKYFAEEIFISFIDELNMHHLLNEVYEENVKKLQLLNIKLYEQLTKI